MEWGGWGGGRWWRQSPSADLIYVLWNRGILIAVIIHPSLMYSIGDNNDFIGGKKLQ